MVKYINRLKIILAEKKHINKWMIEQFSKDTANVSRRPTNTVQPKLDTLLQIAQTLKAKVKDLSNSLKEKEIKLIRNL